MLTRRRRSRLTIRSSAPCRSSTNRTRMCSRAPSWGALAWPARCEGAACLVMTGTFLHCFLDHVGDTRARSDHGIDIGLRLNDEINNYAPLHFHCFVYRRPHIFALGDTHAA